MDFQNILEEIKKRLDIVDVISDYIDLKKSGQYFKALCPFHSEKTPSFTVSPARQIFHCFGCGKGGDIFTFIMEYEKVSFIEAVSILATKAGLDLNKIDKYRTLTSSSKEKLYKIYEESLNFYINQLEKSEKAKTYLKERGINEEMSNMFSLGYAPKDRDSLYKYLKSKGFEDATIKISGLVTYGDSPHDFFRDRLIIPIHNLSGKVVAFGGRLIENSDNLPKYINSSESPIFKKGETVYGLYHAKKTIKQKGYACIVEGYFDVILSHKFGFRNTVAPLGTSLTNQHLKKIKMLTNKILLVFDGDEAGITATEKALSSMLGENFFVKIIILPEGEDPASILQKKGEKIYRTLISKALSPVDFFLNWIPKKNLTEKVQSFLNIISNLKDSIYVEELLKELNEKTGINEMILREELKKIIYAKKQPQGFRERKITLITKNSLLKEEELILRILLSYPDKSDEIFKNLDIEDIEDNITKEIFRKIKELYQQENFSIDKLLNFLNDDEKSFVSRLIISAEIDEETVHQNLKDCFKKICLKKIDKKIKDVSKSGDKKLLKELIEKRKEIIRSIT
jgi:DNA primase